MDIRYVLEYRYIPHGKWYPRMIFDNITVARICARDESENHYHDCRILTCHFEKYMHNESDYHDCVVKISKIYKASI